MFESDMAFSVDDLVSVSRALLAKDGHRWVETAGHDSVTFAVELASGGTLRLDVRPRHNTGREPAPFRTRSLLEAYAETATAGALERMGRAVVLGFLRVMG